MKKLDPFNLDVLKSSCGYIDNFIDGKTVISINKILNDQQKLLLPTVDGNNNKLLKYTMLSILYNRLRKVPFVSAYNIDGTLGKVTVSRKGLDFREDPRVVKGEQLNHPFYDLIKNGTATEFEIGHMASHSEMSWGINKETQSYQTFHFTNSVPQVEKLNSGLWSKLESYVVDETNETDNKRISVFTGPMLKDDDPTYVMDRSFRLPLFFFKIIVFSYQGKLYSTAFVMSQLKRLKELKLIDTPVSGFEKGFLIEEPFRDYNHRDVFQVNIDLIEKYTGLRFKWANVARITIPEDERKLKKISETGGKESVKSLLTKQENFITKPVLTNMILPSRKRIN